MELEGELIEKAVRIRELENLCAKEQDASHEKSKAIFRLRRELNPDEDPDAEHQGTEG